MRIDAAIDEYLSSKQNSLTIKTFRWYEDFLDKFQRWCDSQEPRLITLDQITISHFQAFVSAGSTNNTNTRHHRAQVVKGFLNWCSKDDDMGVRGKMVERMEMPKVVQSDIELLSPQDISKLFRACDKMEQPHRNRAIVHVLLDTGIRASELAHDGSRESEETGIKIANVVFGRRGAESYMWIMGKGRKGRTIGLGQETVLALKRYINHERDRVESEYLFLSSHGEGEPLSVRMLQQFLAELGDLAKVPGVHPHRFRHTFAVEQLLAGTSDLVLMRLLGHTTLESTKIYTRAMNEVQARQSSISVVDQMRRSNKRR